MTHVAEHWNAAYDQGDTTRGWYQPQAAMSMDLVTQCEVPPDAAICDVGSGASVFLDDLLAAGYTDVTAVDLSTVGLALSKQRLGERSARIDWITADVRDWRPARPYRVWHDRAVLHFLRDDADRLRYRDTMLAATEAGSWAILGVFGPSGPDMCAGLDVRRSSPAELAEFLGPEFQIAEVREQRHVRPDGDTQDYIWVRAERIGSLAAASSSGLGHEQTRLRSP